MSDEFETAKYHEVEMMPDGKGGDFEYHLEDCPGCAALDSLASRLSEAEGKVEALERERESNVSRGVSGPDGTFTYVPLTWQELAEQRRDEMDRLQEAASLWSDLDRCEHGRHEGDVCGSCGGPSHGNPIAQAHVVGYSISAKPIGPALTPPKGDDRQ